MPGSSEQPCFRADQISIVVCHAANLIRQQNRSPYPTAALRPPGRIECLFIHQSLSSKEKTQRRIQIHKRDQFVYSNEMSPRRSKAAPGTSHVTKNPSTSAHIPYLPFLRREQEIHHRLFINWRIMTHTCTADHLQENRRPHRRVTRLAPRHPTIGNYAKV